MGYVRTYSHLSVVSLTPAAHERTCGYWYTVTNGAVPHTAFATRAGLDRWLRERGLRLEIDLPERGEWGASRIIGEYRDCSHLDVAEFEAIHPALVTATMSNGDYVLGLIEEDDAGIRTVHYLNPNVRDRLVFDRQRTREVMC